MPGEIVKTAQVLNKRQWRRGIWGALISGGAGAFAAGTSVSWVDSHDFNLESWHGALKLAAVIAITFSTAAFTSVMKFLHEHPLPDEPDQKEQ